MKSYTITLDKDEQSYPILPCLLSRVVNAKYTWYLFLGAASPNPGTGVLGDVWVTTIPGYENVYIRGERDEWNLWYKSVDYGQKRHCNDKNKFKHSYHPWLRDRLLQFNGTDLGWYPRRLYNSHRVSWNDKRSNGRLEYDSLDSVMVALYVRAAHIPRPPVFGGVQPSASTLSSGVAVYGGPPPAASRPAQPSQPPLVPAPTAGRRNAYAGQQTTTPRPAVQQNPAIQRPAVPKATQPAAQNTLPPATSARPAPPRAVPPVSTQSTAPSSSTSASLPPATPDQPPPRGFSLKDSAVQPTAPTPSSSVPAAVGTAPQAQPAAAPKPAAPVVVQSITPTSTSTPPVRSATAQPAQQVSSVPTDPPKYEDVVSETGVKRRRSSSLLSYASKERSPSPKRPNLGLKADGSSDGDAIQAAAPSVPPPTNASQAPAPSLPSSTPAVQPSPVPTTQVSQPSAVPSRPSPTAQPPPASSVQPSSAPVVQADPPASQPSPARSASAQNPTSAMGDAAAASKPSQPMNADTGNVGVSENTTKDLVPLDPGSTGSFLSSLPLSLAHHAAVFTEVGVTNRDHFRLLARLPKPDLDKFLTTVRDRGLSFMESLVLRSALNGLRQPSEVVQAPGGPTTIEAWLEQIGPSMAHHARVFEDLGIKFEHIPVLAQLDAETFQELENALDTAGLTWIERFVVTAKIRDGMLPESK